MDDNVNSTIDDKIEEKIGKLYRTTGKKHTFLGVDIKFIGRNKFAVSMSYYVEEDLEGFGETLKGNVMNPSTSQLFTITSEANEIYYEKKERYHSITAKIL